MYPTSIHSLVALAADGTRHQRSIILLHTPRVWPPGPGDTIISDPCIPSDFPADLAQGQGCFTCWGWGFGTLYEGALAVLPLTFWPQTSYPSRFPSVTDCPKARCYARRYACRQRSTNVAHKSPLAVIVKYKHRLQGDTDHHQNGPVSPASLAQTAPVAMYRLSAMYRH